MKAELFYALGQEETEQTSRRLVRNRIFPTVELAAYPISGLPGEPDSVRKMLQLATRYIRLLQASIPPTTELKIALSGSDYGFYTKSHYYGRTNNFQDGFKLLLPALAVDDRMMLVPFGLSRQLRGTEEYQPVFRPLEMGGVLEVDFSNYELLEAAVCKVGEKLRSEMIQEFRAYSSYRGREEIDFPKLAQDLGIDWQFLRNSLQSQAQGMALYSQLSCRVHPESLPLETWAQLTLTVVNDSDTGLSGLAIDVVGPVQILPRRLVADVAAHSSQELKIAIRALETGEFPLEISLCLPSDQIFRDWIPDRHVWLRVNRVPKLPRQAPARKRRTTTTP